MAQLGEWRGIKHGMKSAALAWRGMLEGTINPAKGESMTDQETPERAHVTADDIEAANDLIDFIEACPSMFHTAATIMAELDEAGFTYLPENAAWDIEPGGRYYTQRNTSSVVAFKVGEDLAATWGEDGVAGDYHFQLTASHSDSPVVRLQATVVSRWLEMPMPATSAGSTPVSSTTARATARTLAAISAGSWLTQPASLTIWRCERSAR